MKKYTLNLLSLTFSQNTKNIIAIRHLVFTKQVEHGMYQAGDKLKTKQSIIIVKHLVIM